MRYFFVFIVQPIFGWHDLFLIKALRPKFIERAHRLLGLGFIVFWVSGCSDIETVSNKQVWHLSTWGNPRAVTTVIETVASEVARESKGSFEIKIHFGEAVSPSRQNLESLSIGLVDAAQTCSSYHPGKTPAMTALELPFLPIDDLKQTIKVHKAFYDLPVVKAELESWNAQLLFLVPTPQPEFMGNGEPPLTIADWDKKRVRATGGLAQAMIELGASPVGVPPPEVYLGLERNLFQAAAFPYSYAFGAYRLFEVSDWYTTNMKAAGFNCPVLVNKDSYAALNADHKAILDAAIDVAYSAQQDAFDVADEKWLKVFDENSLTAIAYEPSLLTEFRIIAADPVWQKWRASVARYDVEGDAVIKDLLRIIEDFKIVEGEKDGT